MKRLMVYAAVGVLLLAAGGAAADCICWTDLSWWGQSGATAAPYKDAARSGYWWWPTQAASNAGDAEAWGNRGVVYSQYTKTAVAPPPPPPTPPTPPPPPPPPKVVRQATVFNNVLFDYDKAVLKPAGKAECDKVIAELKRYPKDTVLIEGHTCDLNRTGQPDYNMRLGQRRADAIRDYLVQQGISPSRITTKSYGAKRPAVANTSEANRALNRRGVFKITVND